MFESVYMLTEYLDGLRLWLAEAWARRRGEGYEYSNKRGAIDRNLKFCPGLLFCCQDGHEQVVQHVRVVGSWCTLA
jgi:hypothetical protein